MLHPVSESFWIATEDVLGFAKDADHGHGLEPKGSVAGSVDTDCHLEVIKDYGRISAVKLHRPETPYGARAPHGILFLMYNGDVFKGTVSKSATEDSEKVKKVYATLERNSKAQVLFNDLGV